MFKITWFRVVSPTERNTASQNVRRVQNAHSINSLLFVLRSARCLLSFSFRMLFAFQNIFRFSECRSLFQNVVRLFKTSFAFQNLFRFFKISSALSENRSLFQNTVRFSRHRSLFQNIVCFFNTPFAFSAFRSFRPLAMTGDVAHR